MGDVFRTALFGVSKAPNQQAYTEPEEEELLQSPAALLDNPVLLHYNNVASSRGVVVFALQDIPVNVPMVSEKGLRVVRETRDRVRVGAQTLQLTRDALLEEDAIRRSQLEQKELYERGCSGSSASSITKSQDYERRIAEENKRDEEEAEQKKRAVLLTEKRKEEERLAEETKRELERQAAEQKRREEESKEAQRQQEEQRRQEEEKKREQARLDEEKKIAEQRIKDEERIEAERKKQEQQNEEDERRLAEQRRQEEERIEAERQRQEKQLQEEEQKREAQAQFEEQQRQEQLRQEELRIADERKRQLAQEEERLRELERQEAEKQRQHEEEERRKEEEQRQQQQRQQEEEQRQLPEKQKQEEANKKEAAVDKRAEVPAKEGKLDRPKKLQRVLSDDFISSKRHEETVPLIHLTLGRAAIPLGRKLPTKPIAEFPGLKPDVPMRYVEDDEEGPIRTTADADEAQDEINEKPSPKKYVPPRGAFALPAMFDPSAVKAGLKKSPTKPQQAEENAEPVEAVAEGEEKPSPKKLPAGAKALPGMGMPFPGMGAAGGVKLKKTATMPARPAPADDEPAQVDFRAKLKPAAPKESY